MNKTLIAVLVLAALVIGAYVVARKLGPCRPPAGPARQAIGTATDSPEPSPGAAVFQMRYRGLSVPDDPLSYGRLWGFMRPDDPGQKDPFVLAVRSRVTESTLVCNASLPWPQWSVVETRDKKPVTFYFDLNTDGKLSDNEKFLPTTAAGSIVERDCPYAFITSDFSIRTQDQREIPFRVMLAATKNGPDSLSYMWSPSCVLEGQATLAGQPVRLVLYADRFSASFTTFGSCSYALFPAEPKLGDSPAHYPLSSLIPYQGTFYRLRVEGVHEKGKTVRVTLEKDPRPTGSWAIGLQGTEALKVRAERVTVNGANDNSIHFDPSDTQSPLPQGRYRLSQGSVAYGVQNADDWQATFNEGPVFEIKGGETGQAEMGRPALSILATDENGRESSGAKARLTYSKGTALYLSPQIKGEGGEVYTRFSRREAGSNNQVSAQPHVTITDPGGKQIVSADMGYG